MTASTTIPTEDRPLDPDELRERWEALDAEEGGLRIRDAAQRLGVGEAQLLSTRLGDGVTRLDAGPRELFEELPALGEVMASTRNRHAVIEKHGVYDEIDIGDHVGVVLADEIDLRIFAAHYQSAFVVRKEHRGEPLHSMQFFDPSGTSLHKVYAKDEEGREALEDIAQRLAHDDQHSVEPPGEPVASRETLPDDEIDVEAFRQDWRELQDTHDFFGMMRRHKVARTQAMRLAPEEFTERVSTDTPEQILRAAAEREVPIMVFVGSPGCIEIHTGPVHRIVETGSWLNVLDPRFNLHLDRSGLTEAWIVEKPTVDGLVTSLEVYDDEGETVAMFFGERKPGIPEDQRWRDLLGT